MLCVYQLERERERNIKRLPKPCGKLEKHKESFSYYDEYMNCCVAFIVCLSFNKVVVGSILKSFVCSYLYVQIFICIHFK